MLTESRRGEGCAREQNPLCLKADGPWSHAFGLLVAGALESEKPGESHEGTGV